MLQRDEVVAKCNQDTQICLYQGRGDNENNR